MLAGRALPASTERGFPLSSLPFICSMAALACASAGISTKPKPLDSPVVLSRRILMLATSPNGSKA
jgi:hypothetical protein